MAKVINTAAADKKQPVMMTTSKLAKSFGIKRTELNKKLLEKGLVHKDGDEVVLSPAGKAAGGEARFSNKYGVYFLWPNDFTI